MARPTDWYVLDLDSDPVPGDPTTVDSIARTWSTVADDADRARGQINSLLGDQGSVGNDSAAYHQGVQVGPTAELTATVNGANVSFTADSGQVIHLSNSSLPNGLPTLQHVAATRPVMHQTLPRILTEPWSVDNVRSDHR